MHEKIKTSLFVATITVISIFKKIKLSHITLALCGASLSLIVEVISANKELAKVTYIANSCAQVINSLYHDIDEMGYEGFRDDEYKEWKEMTYKAWITNKKDVK